MADEYLDLVNEDDVVIGKKKRSEVYSENLSNYRVVNAFVINSKGEMWIPRRSPNKKLFPLALDMSMGGHVESGESYDEALKRELKEELNMDLGQVSYKLLGHLTPDSHGVSSFMNVYEIYSEAVSNYNPNDFIDFFWLKPEELASLIKKDQKTKADLPKLLRIFYQV